MSSALKFGTLRDWASMARLPNVPTVWSNVFTALFFSTAPDNSPAMWVTFAASSMLYVGGTIANDVHDIEFDRKFRPERPIPSGRVSAPVARTVVWVLMVGGSLLFAHYVDPITVLLPVLILAYTKLHKRWPLMGCVLMGLCRMALAMFAGFGVIEAGWGPLNLAEGGFQMSWALSLFVYVFILSLIATGETRAWRRTTVVWMLTLMPLLDAAYIFGYNCWLPHYFEGLGQQMEFASHRYIYGLVPVCCAGLAWFLRRLASAT